MWVADFYQQRWHTKNLAGELCICTKSLFQHPQGSVLIVSKGRFMSLAHQSDRPESPGEA